MNPPSTFKVSSFYSSRQNVTASFGIKAEKLLCKISENFKFHATFNGLNIIKRNTSATHAINFFEYANLNYVRKLFSTLLYLPKFSVHFEMFS